jgi:phosphoenolpyruvate synthase/pyruvate phosphate dikinase
MQLSDPELLNLRNVNAALSGKVCGPKAANLGQLKQLFPENVVEGIVIPFSIFKAHIDQEMPGKELSYWQFLKNIFLSADSMKEEGKSDNEVESYVISELKILEEAIREMPLIPSFKTDLNKMFLDVFGEAMGKKPVFIRSDTNMEDLKDFTGAGLNLTLFNVLDASLILQGIKDVWASPYTERSYKWRQKYLLNPENVFPSILIIPSVNADCSGVLITKGITSGNADDYTVAFSRGVGGAVEGQASETWLLRPDGENSLLSPSREFQYTSIPASGGTLKLPTSFKTPILSDEKLTRLREMGERLNEKLPDVNIQGPYDVELGFKEEKIWLFQVRPFVENKRAAASEYLASISPSPDKNMMISLDSEL